MHHIVVERELELRLVLSPEHSVAVPARLGYRSDDPFAVHVSFHIDSECPVHWTFARDLLVEGVFRPCGHGDVRVWPVKADGRDVVLMAFGSPDGDALLEAPAEQVSAWLERTLRAVPPGTEGGRLDVDEALAGLLAPPPAEEPRPYDPWPCEPWPSDEPKDGERRRTTGPDGTGLDGTGLDGTGLDGA